MLLLESIRISRGVIANATLHNARIYKARRALLDRHEQWDVRDLISLPEHLADHPGPIKCRILYGEQLEKIEYIPYQKRSIERLHLVHADHIDYQHKYADRSAIEELLAPFGQAEDIIMIKKGQVTDFSYGNLLFGDGHRWVTPTNPLLRGTKRQQLIEGGIISETDIRVENLTEYPVCSLINCMMDPGDLVVTLECITSAL